MAKKRNISWWFPDLECWAISSLEMVSIFHKRLSPSDFDSEFKAKQACRVIEKLPLLEDGYQLTTEENKIVRDCCDKIKYSSSFLRMDEKQRKCPENGVYGWRTRLIATQIARFKKFLPYTVAYLPKPIGIREYKKLERPLDDYEFNDALVFGFLRIFVYPQFEADTTIPSGFIANNQQFFKESDPKEHHKLPEGPHKYIEYMSFYLLHCLKTSRVENLTRGHTAARSYMLNQIHQFHTALAEVIEDGPSQTFALH